MRTPSAAAALLALAALVGCSTSSGPAEAPGPTSASTVSNRISDGTYTREATIDEARAVGLDDAWSLANLGPDGVTTITLKVQGDRWTQFQVEDGVPEVGDLGTLTYDQQGNLTLTSESEASAGAVQTVAWTVAGDQLTLSLLSSDGADAHFIIDGTWSRQ